MTPAPVNCLLPQALETTPEVLADLGALLAHLQANQPVTERTIFPRGTVMPDGRLDLCKQRLGVAGCCLVAEALHNNRTIASLLLGTNGIGDAGAIAVSQLIEHNDCLEIVYLGCNAIAWGGVAALSQTLAQNQSVTGLWLKRNPIGVEGADYLAKMLCHNQSIRTLDLVHTQIGRTGLRSILEVLTQTNRTIERLYLGGNQITVEDAPLLAELLRQNSTIKALLLNVNHLGDAGVRVLAEALQQNCTLVELGLASNGMSNEGCDVLLSAIEKHPTLRHLDLGYSPSTKVLAAQPNSFRDLGVPAIAHFLQYNQTLLHLNLRGTGLSAEGKTTLCRALQHNQTLCSLSLDGQMDIETISLLAHNSLSSPHAQLLGDRTVALIRSVYR